MARSLYALLRRRFGPPISLDERRAFLKASAAAGAGLLLSGCAGQNKSTTDAKVTNASKQRIIVVGAGFAGLACAHELLAAGHDVQVIEARPHVSGRVRSFRDFVPGKNVEGGGELIGSNHAIWVAYAEKFGLSMLDVIADDDLESPIVLGGKRLTADESAQLWEELDATASLMNELAAPLNEDQPWLSPNAAALDARTIAAWLDSLNVSPICKQAFGAQLAGDNGVANDRASLLGMLTSVKGGGLEKYWTDSEVYRCKGGNQQLASKLAESIGSHRISLSTPVTAIDRAHASGRHVLVTLANNRTVEGDQVVLAVPPSVWKSIRFAQPFPELLKPQMGTNVKYLSAVRSRFWEKNNQNADALTDGDVTWTWDGTNNQLEGDPSCLNAFSGGPAAERIRARNPTDRQAEYIRELEIACPGYSSQVTATRFMDWPKEQWTGAGYSFPAPGQVTTVGPVLHAGFDRLHFAGEHCCYKFVGYMEGALQSGVAAARKIAGVPAANEAQAAARPMRRRALIAAALPG